MKMTIELPEKLVQALAMIAYHEEKSIDAVIYQAVWDHAKNNKPSWVPEYGKG